MELECQAEGVGSVGGCWKGVAGHREESMDEQGLQDRVGVGIKVLAEVWFRVRLRLGV